MSTLDLYREVRQGRTIWRFLFNRTLSDWRGRLHGLVLDLACGENPSYEDVLQLRDDQKVQRIRVDGDAACRPSIVAELTASLPFRDDAADFVFCFNAIHLLPTPGTLLAECRRVLKPGGTLLFSAPLVHHYRPEPADHWRFTADSLRLLAEGNGFRPVAIHPLGGRWSSAASILMPFLRPRPAAPFVVYWLSLRLDAWARRFALPDCPIGYVVEARRAA